MEKFIVENLDCPHCAKEVEEAVASVHGISNVSLNFITKTLEFEADSEDALNAAVSAAKNVEDGIVLKHIECEKSHCDICNSAEEKKSFLSAFLNAISSLFSSKNSRKKHNSSRHTQNKD